MCFLQQLADYPHAFFSFGGVETRSHPLSGMVRRLATSLCTNGSVFQFMIRILRDIYIQLYRALSEVRTMGFVPLFLYAGASEMDAVTLPNELHAVVAKEMIADMRAEAEAEFGDLLKE